MPQELNDPFLIAFLNSVLTLSAATCLLLLIFRSRGPVLRFQPRTFVPWNVAGAGLASVLVTLVIVTALWTKPKPKPEVRADASASAEEVSEPDLVENLGGWMVQETLLVGGVLFLIVVYFKATRFDLGLPANLRELARDVFVGVVAGLAALAPVLILQGLLQSALRMPEMESQNPLIKSLVAGGPNFAVLLLATVGTVVIAPVCEELTFRLLLQGWLEKWEARRLGVGDPSLWNDPQLVNIVGGVSDADEAQNLQHAIGLREASHSPVAAQSSLEGNSSLEISSPMTQLEGNESQDEAEVVDHCSVRLDRPPSKGLIGLPFGWLPIVISSVFFGLAHFGYGPEPVPLFFLALVLGYVYFRTHRIVPSIVAHAVFNSFTMVLLWRMVIHGAH